MFEGFVGGLGDVGVFVFGLGFELLLKFCILEIGSAVRSVVKGVGCS